VGLPGFPATEKPGFYFEMPINFGIICTMPKRTWDSIDMEAEAQGNAFRKQVVVQIARRALGKKTIAEHRMHLDGTYAIQRKLVKCMEKEQ